MSSCRIDGKPEDVLNPKKKQLEKITPVWGSGLSVFVIGLCSASILLICTCSLNSWSFIRIMVVNWCSSVCFCPLQTGSINYMMWCLMPPYFFLKYMIYSSNNEHMEKTIFLKKHFQWQKQFRIVKLLIWLSVEI